MSLIPISSLTEPQCEDALALLETGFERGGMLTLVGRCEVNYDDRASSYLALDERLVILKSDRTLLVRRAEQRTPVNCQLPGCTHDAHIADGRLIIQSTRIAAGNSRDHFLRCLYRFRC